MGDPIRLPASRTPDLGVVVLATRDAARLERCLRAIAASDFDGRAVQVVLCANASEPDVAALIETTRGAVVMRSRINLGTAATWNRAIDRLDARLVATVHEDAFVDPHALATIADAFDADPAVAIAGGRLSYPDGSVQTRGWIHWRTGVPWPISPQFAPGLELPERVTPVDAVSSAMMLVDRSFWSARGGFDEGTFPAVTTELDLCAGAWALGRTVVTVDDARGVHETGAMVAAGPGWRASQAFREFLIERNCARYADRWSWLLADHDPTPVASSDVDAMRAGLARVASAAQDPVPSSHPCPPAERTITASAPVHPDAPPEVEQRAIHLMADRLDEFASWLVAQWDLQRAQLADISEQLGHVMEVITNERARYASLVEEHAARERTLTWRLRARALRIPGVAQSRARRRGA